MMRPLLVVLVLACAPLATATSTSLLAVGGQGTLAKGILGATTDDGGIGIRYWNNDTAHGDSRVQITVCVMPDLPGDPELCAIVPVGP